MPTGSIRFSLNSGARGSFLGNPSNFNGLLANPGGGFGFGPLVSPGPINFAYDVQANQLPGCGNTLAEQGKSLSLIAYRL